MEKDVRLSDMEHDKDQVSVNTELPIHSLPFPIRMLKRLRLIFRRFTGKRVSSDDMLWFDGSFFRVIGGNKLKALQTERSHHKKGLKYHFNVLISK